MKMIRNKSQCPRAEGNFKKRMHLISFNNTLPINICFKDHLHATLLVTKKLGSKLSDIELKICISNTYWK